MSLLGRRLARPSVLFNRSSLALSTRQQARQNSTILNGLGSCVALTAESLSALHTFGLPWWIVLPLAATGLNFSVRLPAQYFLRLWRLRRQETLALKRPWAAARSAEVQFERSVTMATRGLSRGAAEASRINKDFGASRWRTTAAFLGPMVPFVLVSEAIRRLADSPMTWLGRQLGLDKMLDYLEPGTSALTDSSLSQGGILWFTDLMAADPYGGLPLICTLTLYVTTLGRMPAWRLRELLSLDDRDMDWLMRLRNAFGRALLFIPLFPLLFMKLPAAVFLYWAPTFMFNNVNDRLLAKWLPTRKPRYIFDGKDLKAQAPPYLSIEGYEVPKKGGAVVKKTSVRSR